MAIVLVARPAHGSAPATVVAWGAGPAATVPAGLTDVIAIAAGSRHNLALKSNGTVVAWGDEEFGKAAVPPDLSKVIAIAAGGSHSLALKIDGTMVAWGGDEFGKATVPRDLSGVTAIAAGSGHSLALKSDGTVVAWGRDDYGQATVPPDLSKVIAIAAGGYHSLALRSDGTAFAWGNNTDGQTLLKPLGGVTAIAAGAYHSLALKSDGTVVAWGRDYYGQATVPPDLSNVIAIAAGGDHSLALKSDGTVVAWGYNAYGQATVPAALSGVTAIAAGYYHSLAIGQLSQPPNASAGSDQTVHVGSLVTLDGSGGADPQGLVPLAYAWSFASRPAGSGAVLSNPTSVNATFTADVPGDYIVSLTVTNSAGLRSAPDTALVSTTNSAPIAEAGPDQSITLVGATVILDGSQSYDPDGDPLLKCQWSLVSKPLESKTQLEGAYTASPSFVADAYGDYVVQLLVSDPWVSGAADTVTISFENLAPVANAGTSSSVNVGSAVTLDGSASYDPNGDPMAYRWTIASAPAGSTAAVSVPAAEIISFFPDREGTYVLQLVVDDGLVSSEPSSIQIQAIMTASAAVAEVMHVQQSVATVPDIALKNATMTNALSNKLNSVIQKIQAGDYAAALSQLENDLLPKTDGCATSTPPAPDKNDWITSCSEQAVVYEQLLQLIADVTLLM